MREIGTHTESHSQGQLVLIAIHTGAPGPPGEAEKLREDFSTGIHMYARS